MDVDRLEGHEGLRILEAAEEVFADAGFERARIKDIAKRAGLSVGSVYGVFDGKDAIFLAVHEERSTQLFEAVAELIAADASPLEIIMAGVDQTVRFFCERPSYLRMHLLDRTPWASADQSTPVQSASWQRGIELLSGVFEAGMEDGELVRGDPSLDARMVMAMLQVKLSDWIAREPRPEVSGVVLELQALVRRAFAR